MHRKPTIFKRGRGVIDVTCQSSIKSLYETSAVSPFTRLPTPTLLAARGIAALKSRSQSRLHVTCFGSFPRIFEEKRDCSHSILFTFIHLIVLLEFHRCSFKKNILLSNACAVPHIKRELLLQLSPQYSGNSYRVRESEAFGSTFQWSTSALREKFEKNNNYYEFLSGFCIFLTRREATITQRKLSSSFDKA